MSTVMSPGDYTALPSVAGDHRIGYGEHPDQFGELFLPTDGPAPYPVVTLLHGGCWRARFGLEPLGQFARRLTDHGVAVWNIEYRRLDGGGGWPMTFLDAAAGMDFLRDLAPRFHLDVSRIAAVGHSAGGHLALWLATRHRLPKNQDIACVDPLIPGGVVSLAGIPDVALALKEGICAGAPEELMGGNPSDYPDRYALGSPHSHFPLGIPHWHIAGTEDKLVPAHYVTSVCESAIANGDTQLTVIPVEGAGHFEIVAADSFAWPTVEKTVLAAIPSA